MTRTVIDSNLKQAVEFGTPVEVIDPTTNSVYYLLTAEQFSLLAAGNARDFDPRTAYPSIDAIMADDDANDPLVSSYQ